MRYDIRLKDSPPLHNLDRTLAIAGVILSAILILYLAREIGRVVYLLTMVLALISCLLWLAIRKSHTFEFHLPESRTLTTFWSICFFGLFALSILSVHFRPELYQRPILYFILTALMAGAIACEILSSGRRHAGLVLTQVVLLGVSIAWSQLLIFPSLLGVDPWYHSIFTTRIVDEGSIPMGNSYSRLPIFHLTIAATSLIAGLPYKFAAMVSVSLGQIICNALFVFLITGHLFRNYRAGLLAALMVIIANHPIHMSYWSIPNGFAAVFIPIALYLLFFKFGDRSHTSYALLYILVLATIILTHTIAAMCMAILLLVSWGTLVIYRAYDHLRKDIHASFIRPVGFAVAMFAWWTYASGSIRSLAKIIDWGFGIDAFVKTPEEFRGYAAVIPLNEQLFNNLGMFIFFAFSFIGIFYMISHRDNSSSFAMAWVGMAPLAIGFISLISGHSVVEHRWWYFAQILLSIPLAIAIYIIGTWKLKRPVHLYSFIFGFVVILSILMITSPPANVDNLSFSPNSHMRYSLTEAELESVKTVTEKWDGPIKTDEYLAGSQKFQYPPVSAFCQQIYSEDYLSLRDSIVVIRKSIVGRPFKIFSSIYKLDYDLNVKLEGLGFSRIYDSNGVSGYRA
ncbi:hypothetical protein [Methanosaeta sp. UBA356]|jgi:hypothetical protein|uniref:hypothetical protein n=1 Tax=Methanosaeta sp. UBA356 TaxID=1915559 RepID=UPI00257D787B|nr:hypothetical protein [Methanosaeta sp. UBA356]